jgi:hypothetical protein
MISTDRANTDEADGRRTPKRLLRSLTKAAAAALCLWGLVLIACWVLRKVAIGQIVELTGAKVQARSVDVDLDGSVDIEKLVVRPHQSRGSEDAILKAERVYARFGIWSLILLRPRLREIKVNDFVFDAQYDSDTGRWNTYAFKIKPPKEAPGLMPEVRLERGTVKYSKISTGRKQTVVSVPVDASFGPSDQPDKGYSFDVTTAAIAGGLGQSRITGFWKPGTVTIAGGVSSTDIAAFENVWNIYIVAGELTYDRSGDYSLELVIKDLHNRYEPAADTSISRDQRLLEKFGAFSALQRFFYRYSPEARLDMRLYASGNLFRLSESTLSGQIDCKDVSIRDRRFPYLVEHITGTIDFTEDSVRLNNLTGSHGGVRVSFNGWSKGLGKQQQFEFELTSQNMALDTDLYEALRERQKRLWSAFSPTGEAAIKYRMSKRLSEDKQAVLTVELLDADAAYSRFPYPLRNLTGTLFFDGDGITFSDVVSEYDGRRIAVNGRVKTYDPQRPTYEIAVKAQDIPLDSMLGEALPDQHRVFYSQLAMAGLVNAQVRIFTPPTGGSVATYVANVAFKQAALKLEQLPKEILDMSGQATFTPDLIGIERLTGRYGRSLISLSGRFELAGGAENVPYSLSLQAEQLELTAELLDLLHPTAKQMISRFEPEGRVNLNLELSSSAENERPDYKVVVDCLGNSAGLHLANGPADNVAGSIVQFTYPLRDITGRLVVTRDSLMFDGVTATAADLAGESRRGSTIRVDGRLALNNGAFGDGSLSFSARDIELNERLAAAIPGGIGAVYLQLSPAGRFDMNFDKIRIDTGEDGEKHVEFAGVTRFKNCSFSTVPSLSELDGLLETRGVYRPGSGFREGTAALRVQRVKVERAALSGLQINLSYDESQKHWRTEKFLANCHGGKITGEFELGKVAQKTFEYELQVGFDNIDLKRFLTEQGRVPKRGDSRQATVSGAGGFGRGLVDEVCEGVSDGKYTSGKVSGSLGVAGRLVAAENDGQKGGLASGGSSYSRHGSFRVRIHNMRIGKLSPLHKVLCVLRLTEPQDYAFEQMIIDSYLKEDKVLFELIDLSGPAVAFKGSGQMSLPDKSLDLVFLARGPRVAQAEPSVFDSLTETLGSAVVRIEVKGNLYDPRVTMTTLPVIKDALEVFGTRPTRGGS